MAGFFVLTLAEKLVIHSDTQGPSWILAALIQALSSLVVERRGERRRARPQLLEWALGAGSVETQALPCCGRLGVIL